MWEDQRIEGLPAPFSCSPSSEEEGFSRYLVHVRMIEVGLLAGPIAEMGFKTPLKRQIRGSVVSQVPFPHHMGPIR